MACMTAFPATMYPEECRTSPDRGQVDGALGRHIGKAASDRDHHQRSGLPCGDIAFPVADSAVRLNSINVVCGTHYWAYADISGCTESTSNK